MRCKLKRRFIFLFSLLLLLLGISRYAYNNFSFSDALILRQAKITIASGGDVRFKSRSNVRVYGMDGREVVPQGEPTQLNYAQLLLKFEGKDPVALAVADFKRGEAKSIEMRPAYTDAFDSVHPIGTRCGTVKKRYWMSYEDSFDPHTADISFRMAQKVRYYNLAVTLLPMFQEHNAYLRTNYEGNYKRKYEEIDCVKLQPSEPGRNYTVNGTTYGVERRMIGTPVDYEAMRHQVIALLGLAEKEYEAEKEKYAGMDALYSAVVSGDINFLKSYEGDLTRPRVTGETPVQIALRYAQKDNPDNPAYIYLLQRTQDPMYIFYSAKEFGFDFLRRNNIPFDEAALRKEMQDYTQRRLEREQKQIDELLKR